MGWFPKAKGDLDVCANNILGGGKELKSDHPGFKDQEYRKRRQTFADYAINYKHGQKIENVEYTQQEIRTWGVVYNKLTELYPTYACKEYNDLFSKLVEKCGLRADNIPQLDDISRYLQDCTGFQLRPVAGLLSFRDFLAGFAFRIYYCTQYVRHGSRLFYNPEPDVCHELLGHVPLLSDPIFANVAHEIGLASLGASDEYVEQLSTVFWFTIEYGLCKQDGKQKAYGAGLLSSYGELNYCFGGDDEKPEIRPLSAFEAAKQDYPITTYQPIYYLAESFTDAINQVREFAKTVSRPFTIHYDPYTQSVKVISKKEGVQEMASDIKHNIGIQVELQQKVQTHEEFPSPTEEPPFRKSSSESQQSISEQAFQMYGDISCDVRTTAADLQDQHRPIVTDSGAESPGTSAATTQLKQQITQLQQQLQQYKKIKEDHEDLLATYARKEKKYRSLLLEHSIEILDSGAESPELMTSIGELADSFPGSLQDVGVTDQTSFLYKGIAQHFSWKNFGFKLFLPSNALPSGVPECQITIKAIGEGQFKFPDDSEPISGIYSISSPCTLQKPAVVEIQHCAVVKTAEDCFQLRFVVARSTGLQQVVHSFSVEDGGDFSPNNPYGRIEITQFSLWSIVYNLLHGRIRSVERVYSASLYYIQDGIDNWKVHFVITWDLDVHIQDVSDRFGKPADIHYPVEFDTEGKISLAIPEDGINSNGWTIIPLSPPEVGKEQVDRYTHGRQIPSCQILVEWADSGRQAVKSVHKVTLQGTKKRAFFQIECKPIATSPVTNRIIPVLETEPQLHEFENEIASKIPAKWKAVGIQLGLRENQLDQISADNNNDCRECFRRVFKEWKRRNCERSWSVLIQILQSAAVDEGRLAEEIRQRLINNGE